MTDSMGDIDMSFAKDPEELHPVEDRSRVYRAYRGKRTGGGRMSSLLFVPDVGTHMRRLSMVPFPLTDVAFDGKEIIMEFPHLTVVISGRHLLPVESGIAAGWIAAVEAFNPQRRDKPAGDGEPFIERIRFYDNDAVPTPRHENKGTVDRNKNQL